MTSTQKGYVFLVAPIVLVAFVVFCSSDMQGQKETHASMQCGKHDTYDGESEAYVDDRHSYCPCTGVVLDAETRKPIPGAQVMADAFFSGGIGIESATRHRYEFAQTDEQGRYYNISKISCPLILMDNSWLTLVVYKKGYVVYNSSRIFKGGPRKERFMIKNNTVLLEKWDDKKFTIQDHVDHVDMIGCVYFNLSSGPQGRRKKQHQLYCREAREEMIFECHHYNPELPTPYDRCVKIVDEKLGLLKKKEGKK